MPSGELRRSSFLIAKFELGYGGGFEFQQNK
jgi:hypothetical protein